MKKISSGHISVSWKNMKICENKNGWITNVFPIEVRCRGFIANSTSVFLTNLGLPPSDKRKYMEKIQDKALTASAWIWQSHWATKIWQSLGVSWDTAGALWVSGNDASAPKAPITIGIIVIFMFHCFFNSQARSKYLFFFSLSFSFILWSAGTAKSTILHVLFFLFCCWLL